MIIVDCYYCGCPVEFDPSGKLESMGITLEDCERNNLAVICRLCTDMAEVDTDIEFTVVDHNQLKEMLFKKDAA